MQYRAGIEFVNPDRKQLTMFCTVYGGVPDHDPRDDRSLTRYPSSVCSGCVGRRAASAMSAASGNSITKMQPVPGRLRKLISPP